MFSRSIYNLKIDTIYIYDIPFDRSFLQLSNGIRHVMPSTDTKPELTANSSMAQHVSQPAVYANGLTNQDIRRKSDGRWNNIDQTTAVLSDNGFNDTTCERTNSYVTNMKEWIRFSIIKRMNLSTYILLHNFSKLEINYLLERRATNFTRLKANYVKRKTIKFLFTLQVH
jgi:hypothetical protein